MAHQGKHGIAWTEETLNVTTGCTKVSPGCKNCYAERIAKQFWGDRKFSDILLHEDKIEAPLHWKKPRVIFVDSMSDLFHDVIPFEFVTKLFMMMAKCPQHTFQILTKRPERMADYFQDDLTLPPNCVGLANVWLGVSVENEDYVGRIRTLQMIPAAIRWISFEPLIGPVGPLDLRGIDWVVVGGESGTSARTMDIAWVLDIKRQCEEQGVKFFMKQLSQKDFPNIYKDFDVFPKNIRLREYPDVKTT